MGASRIDVTRAVRCIELGLTPTTICGTGDRVTGKVPAATISAVLKRARG